MQKLVHVYAVTSLRRISFSNSSNLQNYFDTPGCKNKFKSKHVKFKTFAISLITLICSYHYRFNRYVEINMHWVHRKINIFYVSYKTYIDIRLHKYSWQHFIRLQMKISLFEWDHRKYLKNHSWKNIISMKKLALILSFVFL